MKTTLASIPLWFALLGCQTPQPDLDPSTEDGPISISAAIGGVT